MCGKIILLYFFFYELKIDPSKILKDTAWLKICFIVKSSFSYILIDFQKLQQNSQKQDLYRPC